MQTNTPCEIILADGAGHTFFKLRHSFAVLRVMPWSCRQFAIAHLTQIATERLLADRGAILLHHPRRQIAQPPANHAMHAQDRTIFDKLSQLISLHSIKSRNLAWRPAARLPLP